MQIQVINFEVNPEHYQITKMIKTNKNHHLEYMPYHCYKRKEVDLILLISKCVDVKVKEWINQAKLDLDKTVILCEEIDEERICWKVEGFFLGEIDFEKVCQWLMELIKDKIEPNLNNNLSLKIGKIHKDHDLQVCAQSIWKQNPSLKQGGEVHLFVKEKVNLTLKSNLEPIYSILQHPIKGISDNYEYLIIKKRRNQ